MNKQKLHALFKRIEQEHESKPAKENAQEVISNFQRKFGFTLPADLVEFYSHFHEASLFEEVFILEPLDEISQAGTVIYGDAKSLPASWIAFSRYHFCGDHIAIDLAAEEVFPIICLDHEDNSYDVIALSFSEFLEDMLNFSTDEDPTYWCELNKYGDCENVWTKGIYGRATYIEHFDLDEYEERFKDSEQEETGPEKCKRAECERLHVPYSVMCARHHVAMLHGDPPTESVDATPIYKPSRPWESTH